MSDQPDNVLDFLRAQFARLNGRLDDAALWQAETTRRLSAIERTARRRRRHRAGDQGAHQPAIEVVTRT